MSKEAGVKGAEVFFKHVQHPVDFALQMRRYMHAVVLLQNQFEQEWADDALPVFLDRGYRDLTDLCEMLDPLLTKDEMPIRP